MFFTVLFTPFKALEPLELEGYSLCVYVWKITDEIIVIVMLLAYAIRDTEVIKCNKWRLVVQAEKREDNGWSKWLL